MLHVPNAAPTPTSLRFAESQTATLAASHPNGMADAASDRGVSAVIEGFFRFTDQSLAGVASSGGAARALITGYAAQGPRVLALLDGAFSVAIWNADRREMLLATDRFGIRPVVYAPLPDGIAFGPDANGLREHPRVRATLDPRAIFDYLYFSAIPSPSTIYREMRRLEPAQYVLWIDGQIRAERYWIPAFQPGHEDTASLNHDLHQVLGGAIARCDPDRDAGAFLSGGLDSSTISGMLARHQAGAAKTFTIGFDAEGYDETGYARIASSHFGNTAHEYYVTPCDVADTIDRIATAYDEPFGNSSAVPTFYCARLAAETGVSTILAGDGGDEIFAGNERYAKQKVFETWLRVPSALRRGLVEPLAFHLPFGGRLFPVRKLRRYIEQARVPLPDRLQTFNFLHMTPLADIFAPGFLRDIEPDRPLKLLREEYRRVEGDFVNRMLYLDWRFTLAENDLRKVTVMCEQAGIEVRYPMLDNAVVEFSTHIPTGILLPRFRLRHFYREAMRGFLPDEILSKRKHGFGLPFGVWLATSPELMSVVDQCFAGMRKRDIFRADYLDDILRRHRTKHASFYGTTVWLIIVLEKWLAARRL
jgi:asparagine synthase (glutamine-hydrolysing)